ncbi:MAG: HAD family hydrolase [Halodesulfurarchaeum sp.]
MHVVFDLDGVLLDSERDLDWLERALTRTLEDLDLPVTDENLERLYPGNLSDLERTAEAVDVPAEELWRVRNEHYVREKTSAIESGEIRPYDDVEIVREIASRYPVSIVSNSPQSVVETFVEEAWLQGVFEMVIGRGTDPEAIEQLKPDTHPYERLVDAVGEDRFVYVGDSDSDREFAERTGMAFVQVDREGGRVSDLRDVRARLAELE